MRHSKTWPWLLLVAACAAAVAWAEPRTAGDLRPSPDAVEYGLSAVSLARGEPPALHVAETSVPPRYPFGFALLAAPLVALGARDGPPQPYHAVLLSEAAGVAAALAVAWSAGRTCGRLAGALAGLLVVVAPFFAGYAHLVMAEMPSAAALAATGAALVAAASSQPRVTGRWAMAAGLLLALAGTVRLTNLLAVPGAALGLLVGARCGRGRALWGLAGGLVVGLAPLLVYQWLTFGSPLRTGYAVWTPEWGAGGRPAFSLSYAFSRPALPGSAAEPNLAHYLRVWIGLPARGDASAPVSPLIHPSLAGLLAIGAIVGAVRLLAMPSPRHPLRGSPALPAAGEGRRGPSPPNPLPRTGEGRKPVAMAKTVLAARPALPLSRPWERPGTRPGATGGGGDGSALAIYSLAGIATAFAAFAPYFYQDARYIVPWMPLWLLLAAAGISWPLASPASKTPPSWRRRAVQALAVAVAAAVILPAGREALASGALWQRAVARRPAATPARLAQVQALSRETAPDAWLVSALDAPFVDYYAVRGTSRRYVPLARGLEFVDKPPLRHLQTAADLHAAIRDRLSARAAGGAAGAVVLDRWSLEFAEAYPDFGRELERALGDLDLVPAGSGAPITPAFYDLALAQPDRHLPAYALRDGQALRGSGDAMYVYEGGRRRHIVSIQAFATHGLSWNDVRRLPDRVLALLPDGPPLE